LTNNHIMPVSRLIPAVNSRFAVIKGLQSNRIYPLYELLLLVLSLLMDYFYTNQNISYG
jgi:hypothetical protein